VRKGFHIWSSRFDRENPDVFELQDELATAVVSALQERLALNLHRVDLQTRTPMQAEAYDAYLRVAITGNKDRSKMFSLAGKYFEQALIWIPTLLACPRRYGRLFIVCKDCGSDVSR